MLLKHIKMQVSSRHINGWPHSFYYIQVEKLNWVVSFHFTVWEYSVNDFLRVENSMQKYKYLIYSGGFWLSGWYLIWMDQVCLFLVCRIWRRWKDCELKKGIFHKICVHCLFQFWFLQLINLFTLTFFLGHWEIAWLLVKSLSILEKWKL